MELHELLQWTLNFFFIGVIVWQWRESKRPKLLSQTRLPSLHDEKAKALTSSLEKLESESGLKFKAVLEQWESEARSAKEAVYENTRLQKQNAEIEMQGIKKQGLKEIDDLKKQWQTEMIEARVDFEQTMNRLKSLCQEAQRLIQNAKSLELSESPSHEEKEIKEALLSVEENQIPTVRELEDARTRLKRESTLDLKSVLNEQLA